MRKNMQVYLDDMLDSINLIQEYTKGLTLAGFQASDQVQDAVFRRLGIIGEAASRISPELRETHPEIPWHRLVGLRNIIIHEYKKWILVAFGVLLTKIYLS
jgi:uncharacterized protein with HEPN domain